MTPVFLSDPLPKSIFLAGTSARAEGTQSWSTDAMRLLDRMHFDGGVYVPERSAWLKHDQEDRYAWEREAMGLATVVVLWIPLEVTLLPTFAVPIEWSLWLRSGKVVLGYPLDARNLRYLAQAAHDTKVPVHPTLEDTLRAAVAKARAPFDVSQRKELLSPERYI